MTPILTDAHTHLPLEEPVDCAIICPAQKHDWNLVLEMAKQHSELIPAIGIHPWFISETDSDQLDILSQCLTKNPRILLGEVGLDKCKKGIVPLSIQKLWLESQLKLARQFRRPVVLHCCQAWGTLFEAIKPYSDLSYMLHGWNGSTDMLKRFLSLNTYISLGSLSTKWEEQASYIPMNRMLIESDHHEGTLYPTYEKIGNRLHMTVTDLNQHIRANLLRFASNMI